MKVANFLIACVKSMVLKHDAPFQKQALPHFENIQHSIFHTLNSLNSSLSQTKQAHAHFPKTGVATELLSQYANHQDFDDNVIHTVFVYRFNLDSFVQSSLIHLYVKCQNATDAHKVFDRLAQPDVKTFSALLAAYARQGCVDVAKKLINEMGSTSLNDAYGKCGCTWKMSKVFHEMDLDVSDCNVVTGLCRNGLADNALEVFRQFQSQGMELNVVSWMSMIAGFSQNGKGIPCYQPMEVLQH